MTDVAGIRKENSYKEALIKSGSLRFLTHGEMKRLFMFIMRLSGKSLSSYPGKGETERTTGLSHRLTEKIDLTLGKMGFLVARDSVTVKGGKVYRYYLNPELPKITKADAKRIREEVRHLWVKDKDLCEGNHLKREACHFWGQRPSPSVFKQQTTLKNPEEPCLISNKTKESYGKELKDANATYWKKRDKEKPNAT